MIIIKLLDAVVNYTKGSEKNEVLEINICS